MTSRAIGILAAVIGGLVMLLLLLDGKPGSKPAVAQTLLLPELETLAAELERLTITRSGDDRPIALAGGSEGWVVTSRDDYPADVSKLRQLVIALSEARIVEEKTADPAQYDKLGVADPTKSGSGSGTLLTFSGNDQEIAVILGETAQGRYRYARRPQQPKSFLVDRNPSLPGSAGAWLRADILDLPASDVRRVSIEHADGESIVIEKTAKDQADFTVRNIPEGRELTYATVTNSLSGALAGLELEDVREMTGGAAASTALFETWDGLTITVTAVSEDEHTWFAFAASSAEINDRVSGWQYRLPAYKKDLLTRRWNELLKPAE